jgi:hypothetical protein
MGSLSKNGGGKRAFCRGNNWGSARLSCDPSMRNEELKPFYKVYICNYSGVYIEGMRALTMQRLRPLGSAPCSSPSPPLLPLPLTPPPPPPRPHRPRHPPSPPAPPYPPVAPAGRGAASAPAGRRDGSSPPRRSLSRGGAASRGRGGTPRARSTTGGGHSHQAVGKINIREV